MNTTELAACAASTTFQDRCNYFLVKTAMAVMTEGVNVSQHNERVNFARMVLMGNISKVPLAIQVLSNPTIASAANEVAIVDGDIEYQVVQIFTTLAIVHTT